MTKRINLNFQQAFAIKPQGVRYCRRGICRREILDMVQRAYCDGDAEWQAERQAAEKAAKKAAKKAGGR